MLYANFVIVTSFELDLRQVRKYDRLLACRARQTEPRQADSLSYQNLDARYFGG